MDSARHSYRNQISQLGWLCGIVLLVRTCSGLAGWQSLQEDPDAYAQLAVSLADDGVLGFAGNGSVRPSAFRPPLYPWLLSWMVSDSKLLPAGVFVMHLGMALAIAILAYSIARKLGLRWPWCAGLLVTVDPVLIRAGQQVMTELLATFLAALAWWLWLTVLPKKSAGESKYPTTQQVVSKFGALLGLGLVLGLSSLARPAAVPWAVVCIVSMWWLGYISRKHKLINLFVVTCGVLVCLLPWTLRNLTALGRPIWATTHGGYTLLLANNPSLYQHFSQHGPSRAWNAESFHNAWANRGIVDREALLQRNYWLNGSTQRETGVIQSDINNAVAGTNSDRVLFSLGELADDRLAYELALQTICTDPSTFVLSCCYRLSWLWACWPHGAGYLATRVIGLWYGTVFLLATKGFLELLYRAVSSHECDLNHRKATLSKWLPGLALIVVLSGMHCVFWSNMRMRAPAMTCVYLLALIPVAKRISMRDDVA